MDTQAIHNLIMSIASGDPISYDDIARLDVDLNTLLSDDQRTFSGAAAYANNADLIRTLVGHGATIDLKYGYFHCTAPNKAAVVDSPAAIRALLELGVDIEAESGYGSTPLMLAAAWGNQNAVELLLAHGAKIDRKDKQGFTAQMMASEKNHPDVADFLARAEASITDQCDAPQ